MSDFIISASGLRWLAILLAERFGGDWTLRRDSRGLVLRLRGEDGYIVFDELEDCFTRASSDLCFSQWDAEAEDWQSILGSALPAPGVRELTAPLITRHGRHGHVIHYDILGLTYWMLARVEEIGRTDLDAHGRFPSTSSHASRFGYLERPVVDEWLHVLGQVIERQWPGTRLKRHNFQIRLSHDVDRPSRFGFASPPKLIRRMGGDLFRRGDLRSFVFAPWIRLRSRTELNIADPYNTFDWIMDQSEKHGLTSAFYFICGRTDTRYDAEYEIEHPAMRELMRRIHSRGHEIGLHPSYNTYRSPNAIRTEADRLRFVCREEGLTQSEWGGRMHYLRWEVPTTLLAWEAANMSYDSTLGYADRAGFRCGTCFEYAAFDPVGSRCLNLRIRPLIVMEQGVLSAGPKNRNATQTAAEKFQNLREVCRKVEGQFTLLWHNSELTQRCQRNLYKAIL